MEHHLAGLTESGVTEMTLLSTLLLAIIIIVRLIIIIIVRCQLVSQTRVGHVI